MAGDRARISYTAARKYREMVGLQGATRTGVVRVRLNGDRVSIAGQAVTVLRAELANEG